MWLNGANLQQEEALLLPHSGHLIRRQYAFQSIVLAGPAMQFEFTSAAMDSCSSGS